MVMSPAYHSDLSQPQSQLINRWQKSRSLRLTRRRERDGWMRWGGANRDAWLGSRWPFSGGIDARVEVGAAIGLCWPLPARLSARDANIPASGPLYVNLVPVSDRKRAITSMSSAKPYPA